MAIEEGRTGTIWPGGHVGSLLGGPAYRRRPRLGAAVVALVLAVVLAGCGDDDDEPTAAPTSPAATAVPATATAPSGAVDATPGASPGATPAATPATVGDLAGRIAAAWSGVTTYRVNEVTFPIDGPAVPPLPAASPGASPIASPAASPVASPAASPVAGPGAETLVIDEVVLPDRKRRRIVEGGEVVSEIVVVEGQVYVRGAFVRQYVDPALPPETWVALDLDGRGETPVEQLLAGFLAPVGAPLSALPPERLTLPVRPTGQTTVDGRACDVYEVVQTTETGERIDVAIGVDVAGLPCLVETRAGGQVTLATFVAFNEPIAIEAPAEFVTRAPIAAATPAATPAGGATPAG